ncbi:MAG: oligoribonuclease [Acidimicrobiia bacterium]
MPEAPLAAANDRLVWLDLEMTGLDVRRHVIVEIAVLVTDGSLEELDDGIDLVVHQPAAAMAEMDDFVRAMHTRSGLLTSIESSTLSLADAGGQALDYVRGHVPEAGTAPLCGNSIGVDRRFLDHQLPELDAYVHYRSIDVSSLKELCRRWYPDVYKRRPGKAEAHRALADIRESIAELRYYREHLLIPSADASDAPDAPDPADTST